MNKIFLLLNIYCFSIFAQQDSTTYSAIEGKKIRQSPFFTQLDFIIPLRANQNRGTINLDGSSNSNWFIPNGIALVAGWGLQQKKWVGVSAHSGIDALITQKLVLIPVFINFRISPRIYDETRLVFQVSMGQAFALGRGNLYGKYQKYSIGLETDEDVNIFLAATGYDFNKNKVGTGYIGIGAAIRRF